MSCHKGFCLGEQVLTGCCQFDILSPPLFHRMAANEAFLFQPAQSARNSCRFYLKMTYQIGLGNAAIQMDEVQDHPFRTVKSQRRNTAI